MKKILMALLAATALFMMTSCDLAEEESKEDYEGTWVPYSVDDTDSDAYLPTGIDSMDFSAELKITSSSITYTMETTIKGEDQAVKDIFESMEEDVALGTNTISTIYKGDISVSGNKMTRIMTSVEANGVETELTAAQQAESTEVSTWSVTGDFLTITDSEGTEVYKKK